MRCDILRPTFGEMNEMKAIPLYKKNIEAPLYSDLVPKWNKSIFIHTNEFIYRIQPEEILYIKAESNYATLFLTHERKILASKTLKYFSELLNAYLFVRTHQSYLINIIHTEGVRLNESLEVAMDCGTLIPVSRSKKQLILNYFKNH